MSFLEANHALIPERCTLCRSWRSLQDTWPIAWFWARSVSHRVIRSWSSPKSAATRRYLSRTTECSNDDISPIGLPQGSWPFMKYDPPHGRRYGWFYQYPGKLTPIRSHHRGARQEAASLLLVYNKMAPRAVRVDKCIIGAKKFEFNGDYLSTADIRALM